MNDRPLADKPDYVNDVAIIGMAGRFPKAKSVDEFWQNLENSRDCITFYQEQELIDAGIDPEVVRNPDYVKAKGAVDDVDMFDAAFFGINTREAELTDPQHRMLLECAQEALENAGYDSGKYDGTIGIYAGKSMDYYLLLNVFPYIKKEISAGSLQAAVGNDKDSLTTTISYRLNLTGPAITIQTSSSTSLVAVCVAVQSLLTYQCDIALAGGITAGPPIKSGYLFQEGNIWAPDGHCRAFDAQAKGFVPGTGMGLVVLKRLEDAIADGDTVWAVIKGFSVNNDGSKKVSYHAPSVDAQAEVVTQALASADVHADTIQYIETHGTGTNLGDPIEMTALTKAFRAFTDKKQFCAIGSVKTNIGHLDNAAGVTGLIKVAMALKHRKIPATLHFKKPNPKIDFANSPFFVNTSLVEWKRGQHPRRAGITSLGMGGTNAHVVLEEAPEIEDSSPARQWQLLMLSARTPNALEQMTGNLAAYLGDPARAVPLSDVSYTLKVGRKDFNQRRFVLCRETGDALPALSEKTPGLVFDGLCQAVDRPVVFMFSGQGAQYVDMGRALLESEPVFKENIDRCAAILLPLLGTDLCQVLYPETDKERAENSQKLNQTWLTQPALFAVEYALAQLWMSWGIRPKAMIGHSIGEYVAACLSGCMNLEEALKLVAARGRLMYAQEPGAMLTIGLDEAAVEKLIAADLSIAGINSPKHTVVSGKEEAVARLEKELTDKNIFCRRLLTSHAFHSPLMDGAQREFEKEFAGISLKPPQIPFISCVSGTWIKAEEAVSPGYWANQLRQAVRFSGGLQEILTEPGCLLLEIGPGNSLCLLAKEHRVGEDQGLIQSSLRHVKQSDEDSAFLHKTLGRLWLQGVRVDWPGYYRGERRRRIPLPTYPFERKRFWLEEVKERSYEGALERDYSGQPDDPGTDTAVQCKRADLKENRSGRTFQPRPALPTEYIAPGDEVESTLTGIWEDILGYRSLGIKDNFFDLGGNSLSATVVLSHLKERFGTRLEMRSIFEEPTIAHIAGLVRAAQKKVDADIYTPLVLREAQATYPLSSAQKRFYMLQHLDLAAISYNMTGIMAMDGPLDQGRFHNAFQKLIERHESLRTGFEMAGSEPVQRVYEQVAFELEVFRAAGQGSERSAAAIPGTGMLNRIAESPQFVKPQAKLSTVLAGSEGDCCESSAHDWQLTIIQGFIRPFDLTRPPLLRIGLIKLTEEKHIFLFDMHHIISDRTSMGLLLRDFKALYTGREVPPLPIQYKDFCQWQNELIETGKLAKQQAFWVNRLSGKRQRLCLPTDFPRPEFPGFAGETIAFAFDEALTGRIHQVLRESNTSLFMILLTLYNVILAKYTLQDDIIVGLPIAGRNHRYLENLIGLLMETLVIRNFPSGDLTFAQFLGQVRENTLTAFENRDYPFRELVKQVSGESDPRQNPLFDAMLILQNMEGSLEDIQIDDLKLSPYKGAVPEAAMADITLEAEEIGGRIVFHLRYATDLFKRETMTTFARVFREITATVIENGQVRLADIQVSLDLEAVPESGLYKGEASEFEF